MVSIPDIAYPNCATLSQRKDILRRYVAVSEKETSDEMSNMDDKEGFHPEKESLTHGSTATKKQNVFLVDSENVHNGWINLLDKLWANDQIYVFYTDSSPTVTYETMLGIMNDPNRDKLIWVHCIRGDDNALDFQLVTALGHMIATKAKDTDARFIIFSRDKGYDAVVHYWGAREVKVERIPSVKHLKWNESEKGITYMNGSARVEKPARTIRGVEAIRTIEMLKQQDDWREQLVTMFAVKTHSTDPEGDAEYTIKMSKIVDIDNPTKYQEALVAQFGPGKGMTVFNFIKNNKDIKESLSNGRIRNQKIRKKDYVMLFLKQNCFSDKDVRAIAPLLNRQAPSNMDSVRRLINKNNSVDRAKHLMAIIKRHEDVLRMI